MIPRFAQLAHVGARGTDSVQLVTAVQAKALKASGNDFAVQYLGEVTPDGVDGILAAGLGFFPVTFADRFDGAATVRELAALGMPSGVTAWLDLEGSILSANTPKETIDKCNAWASDVIAGGWQAGIYVGSPEPLTGPELFALKVTRYWKAPSQVRGRDGVLTEPRCGWCMLQLWDSIMTCGVWSDYDVVQKDYEGRLPTWCVAGSVLADTDPAPP